MSPARAFASELPPGISDTFTIVDDAGRIVSDIHGKPAVATISDAEEGTTTFSAILTMGRILPGDRIETISLKDPGTNDISDLLTLFSSGAAVALCALSDTTRPPFACAAIGNGFPEIFPSSIPETGQPQELATFPSPSGGGNFHIIVQSGEPVPEPSTELLFGAGLGCMSVGRGRWIRSDD
jgi:hypothetical protein